MSSTEGDVTMNDPQVENAGLADRISRGPNEASPAVARKEVETIDLTNSSSEDEIEDVDMDIEGSSSPSLSGTFHPATQDVPPNDQETEERGSVSMDIDTTSNGNLHSISLSPTSLLPLASSTKVNILEEARRLMGPIILQNALRRDPTVDMDLIKRKLDAILTDEHCQHFVRLAKEAQTQMANAGLTVNSDPKDPPLTLTNNSQPSQGPNIATPSALPSASTMETGSPRPPMAITSTGPNGRPPPTAPRSLSKPIPPTTPRMPRAMLAVFSTPPPVPVVSLRVEEGVGESTTSNTLDTKIPLEAPRTPEATKQDDIVSEAPSEAKDISPPQVPQTDAVPSVSTGTSSDEDKPPIASEPQTQPITGPRLAVDEALLLTTSDAGVEVSSEDSSTDPDSLDTAGDEAATVDEAARVQDAPPVEMVNQQPSLDPPAASNADLSSIVESPTVVNQERADPAPESDQQNNAEEREDAGSNTEPHVSEDNSPDATVPQPHEPHALDKVENTAITSERQQDQELLGAIQPAESEPTLETNDQLVEPTALPEGTDQAAPNAPAVVTEQLPSAPAIPLTEQRPEPLVSLEPLVTEQNEELHEHNGEDPEAPIATNAAVQEEPCSSQETTEPEPQPPAEDVRTKTLTPPPSPPPSPIPGLWLVLPGGPYADVLSFNFSVDARASDACERWAARHMKFNASALHVQASLLCLPLQKVTELPYLLDPSTPLEEVVSGLEEIDNEWPEPGKLVVELHAESGEQQIWLRNELGKGPLDISPYIRQGSNTARFVQLSSMSDKLFILIASRPSQDEADGLEKLSRQRSIWNSFVERTMAKTHQQSGIKVSYSVVTLT